MNNRRVFGSARIPGPIAGQVSPQRPAKIIHGGGRCSRRARTPSTPPTEAVWIGNEPTADGEINDYHVSEYSVFWVPQTTKPAFLRDAPPARSKRRRARREGSYQVIFVNGQDGNPKKHKMQACALAAVSGGPVKGIYNKSTNSVVLDTLKSIWLKGTSSALLSVEATVAETTAKVLNFFGAEGGIAQEEAVTAVRTRLLTADCPASVALFDLLLKPEYADARIVGHSQGNIIICNALNALIACRGTRAVSKMHVIAIASPTVFWEISGSNLHIYNMRNDLVGWLSLDLGTMPAGVVGWSATDSDASQMVTGYESSYWNVLSHSFYLYLSQLWDDLASAWFFQ